jgi:hypothetical protein
MAFKDCSKSFGLEQLILIERPMMLKTNRLRQGSIAWLTANLMYDGASLLGFEGQACSLRHTERLALPECLTCRKI